MTRIETLQRSVVQANEQRIDSLKDKLTALTTLHREVTEQAAKLEQAPESLSAALTPLAEAMAALTEETKETLRLVVQQSRQGHQAALASVKQSTEQASAASKALQSRLRRLKTLAERLEALEMDRPPMPSPWPPAIVAGLMPVAALLWLAYLVRSEEHTSELQ